ncbi:MAG: DUF3365 domain-containing protein [Planctomycetaceae bacterium]|nr:DUF3365 domain-containing protein [Planctomycetaceae bacterium]
MDVSRTGCFSGLCTSVVALVLGASGLLLADEPSTSNAESNNPVTLTVAEARRQAEVLHSAMHAAVQLTHHRYYKEDEGLPIPAVVVEEMFREIAAEQQVELRWLAVEGQAMNTDHKAKTEFEHAAVKALKDGKGNHEEVSGDLYRRAGAITLRNECLKCHVPDRKSTENRTAGLIITIPLKRKAVAVE